MHIQSIVTGTILPWFKGADDIPPEFALCDGNNGTPNLKNHVPPKDESPRPSLKPPAYIMKT